ncbi:hypothetical protein, partial [Helicobacter trogontum]|uniref:hypothetical protein n=1 Tax=Helicobacter trogontum TaxID=50960 RepID=UPI0034E8505E
KVFTRGNPLLFGATTLFEGGKTLSNISEWADSKYSYAILGSILKPLTQDIAPLITLFENYALHTTLIIDNAILIDFSGLNTTFINKLNNKISYDNQSHEEKMYGK